MAGLPVFMAVFPCLSGRIDMAANDPDQVPDGGEDPRLASLDERLKAAHHAEAERMAPVGQPTALTGKGASQGNRVLSTLIGFPLGSAVIGWFLDRQFGSSPKGLLILLFLGIAAAGREIWRISKEHPE